MAAHYMKASIVLIILSAVIPHVTSEEVYISPSQQECPEHHSAKQCLTLQEYMYVSGNYATNFTSLQILPGIHHINISDTTIPVSDIYSLEVNGSNATIHCNGNYFEFRRIEYISIRGVGLIGCSRTSFTSVHVLTIHDTRFDHHGPVILNSVHNATIINSLIINGRKLLVHNSTLLIKAATFSNLTYSDNNFEWDQDPHGGAMRADSSSITIDQCLFLNNNFFNSSIESWGGAIYANNTRLSINNSSFTRNSATTAGGAISANNSLVQITSSYFKNNLATEKGGAIHIIGPNTISSIRLYYCSFISNKADIAGVLYTAGNGIDIIINVSTFNSNKAKSTGGVLFAAGINNFVIVQSSLFTDNAAEYYYGGVLHITGNYSMVNILQSMFHGSAAYKTGGALNIEGSTSVILIDQSEFLNSKAQEGGGTLSFTGSNTDIYVNASVFSNSSARVGGALQMLGVHTNITVDQCDFSNNRAYIGAVLHVNSTASQVVVTESSFANNSATERGGGVIAIFGSQLKFDQNTILFENYGGIINACRSNVTASDNIVPIVEFNPNSYCTLYDVYQDMPMITDDMNTTEAGYTSFTFEDNTTISSEATTTSGTETNTMSGTTTIPGNTMPGTTTTPGNTRPGTTTVPGNTRPGTTTVPGNTMPGTTTIPGNTMPGTTTIPGITATTTPWTNETPETQALTTKPATPNSEDHSVMSTIPNIYTKAIYATLGIAIVVCVLLALLYIIVMCIVLYLCGVFKSKKRLVDNPYLYVPMKENESNPDSELPQE